MTCPGCGEVTCAKLPAGVPPGMCGPGLMALIGLLTGDYNLSRRRAVRLLGDVLEIDISLGALSAAEENVSDAVAAAVEEAREHVADDSIKHVDATGWRSGVLRAISGSYDAKRVYSFFSEIIAGNTNNIVELNGIEPSAS